MGLTEQLSTHDPFMQAVKGLLDGDRSPEAVRQFIPDVDTFKKLWLLASGHGVDDSAMALIVGCSREQLDGLDHVPLYPVQKLAERLDARL